MDTKQITVGGVDYTIAPLTLRQVRKFLDPKDDASPKDGFETGLQTIATSLNNAGGSATVDTLQDSLSLQDFNTLHGEVLVFSGLKVKVGEVAAAPEQPTSDTSAAA